MIERLNALSSGKRAKTVRDFVAESEGLGTLTEKLEAAEGALTERAWGIRSQKRKAGDETELLVFELDLVTEEYEWLSDLVAQALPGQLHHPDSLDRLFDKVPLVFITTLVGNAFLHDSSSFWDSYWQRLGVKDGSVLYALLRRELHRALARKQFATFLSADLSQRNYVGVLELHAGIPSRDLSTLITLIDEAGDKGTAFRSAQEFGTWAVAEFAVSDPRQPYPISLTNLVTHLPHRASHIFARIYELREYANEHGGWPADAEFEGTNGLPEPTFRRLIGLLSGETKTASPASPETEGTPDEDLPLPHLLLDLDSLNFQLVFPALSSDEWPGTEPPRWSILIDGSATSISPRPDWSHGGFEEEVLPLNKPFTRITMIKPDGPEIPVRGEFSDSRPFLFLRPSGKVHQNQKALQGREVYAVMPSATILTARTQKNKPFNYHDLGPVPGWPDWVVRRIPLADIVSVTVSFRGIREQLTVTANKNAVWEGEDHAIPYLKGPDLRPVYHSSPTVTIPDDTSTWELRYSHLAPGGEQVDLGSYVVEDELRNYPFNLFDDHDDPWVGQFRVTVFKDGGIHAFWDFNLAEDLQLRLSYQGESTHGHFRIPSEKDSTTALSKAYAYFHSEPDAQLHHPREAQELGAKNRETSFSIASAFDKDSYQLQVQVDAPRLQYRLPQVGEQAQWSDEIQKISFDELTATDEFQLRFPQRVYDVALLVTEMKNGTPFPPQKISLSKQGRSNVWSVAMSRIKAELEKASEYHVVAQWYTLTAEDYARDRLPQATRRAYFKKPASKREDPRPLPGGARLFSVSKAPLLKGAHVEDATIILDLGRATTQPLIGWVWLVSDPLHPPIKLDVKDRRAPIPPEFLRAGPLIVDVKEEGFLMLWEPKTPSARAVVVTQPGLPPEQDPLTARRWLFSYDTKTELLGDEIQTVWVARDNLHHVLAHSGNRRYASLARFDATTKSYLLDDPRMSLSELDKSAIPQERQLEAFTRSGLVFEHFGSWHTAGDIHPVPWIGLIQEMNDYRVLTGARKDDPSVSAERAESEHYIRSTGGPDLWKTMTDPGYGADLIHRIFFSEDELDRVNSPHYTELHEQLGLSVGGAPVISEDTRLQAQLEWVDRQRDLVSLPGLPELFAALSDWESLIDHTDDEELKKTTRTLAHLPERRVRDKNDHWLYVPYISFVSNLLARLQAHKLIRPVPDLEKFRGLWADCAGVVPGLAAFDVVLAEAIALRAVTAERVH